MLETVEATERPNRRVSRSSGADRGPDGRFIRNNQASVRHRLRAGQASLIRRRHSRLNRLLRHYLELRAAQGRPISATALPLAYRYIEGELRATDLFSALEADPLNAKLAEMYTSAVRSQALIANQLGESVSRPKGGKVDDLRTSALWQIAEASRAKRLEARNGDH